ncbi:MAG: hypothetical protein PHG67_10300 [Bacteroidales bacterium]|jgi:hypothetical protein|nr:hypothetical protein [Bacteroidales bacterium]
MRVFWLCFVVCVFYFEGLRAQEVPLSVPFEHQLDRYYREAMLKAGEFGRHDVVKPLLLDHFAVPDIGLMDTAGKELSLVKRKLLYEHLINYSREGFSFQLDPLFDFGIGYEGVAGKKTWVNTRGLQLQGNIGKKISFYSSLYENQQATPAYIDRFINSHLIMPVVPGTGIMPGQGIVRDFKDGTGWDYSNATAYISYSPNQYLNFQFGHDRHFIGSGYRSLLLSDVSYPYPYFRLQANLGPLQYTYWLMQHTDPGAQPLSFLMAFRKKYASMGFLNWQVNKKLQIGLFQALTWLGDDSISGVKPPAWQYMNPVVFLHPVHYGNGSDGNLNIGLNLQWVMNQRMTLYSQLLFDEVRINELFSKPDAATNKYGVQLGMKFYEAFKVQGLFFQTEVNVVRPYTYSHISRLSNYGHYLQPLAHPAGANFYEFLLLGDYRFKDRWYLEGKLVYSTTGVDTSNVSYGSDIFKSYNDAPDGVATTNVYIGQGLESVLFHGELRLGYLLNPKTNMRLEARFIYREQGPLRDKLETSWFMVGFKTALRNLYGDF